MFLLPWPVLSTVPFVLVAGGSHPDGCSIRAPPLSSPTNQLCLQGEDSYLMCEVLDLKLI